jgi:hypothetical protein
MDELSTQELRGAAFAVNLRRALGAPVEGNLPSTFESLLQRLGEVQPPRGSRQPESQRLGA